MTSISTSDKLILFAFTLECGKKSSVFLYRKENKRVYLTKKFYVRKLSSLYFWYEK